MEYIELNNGTRIPAAGIGTFRLKPEEAEGAVIAALKNGYELIDTANSYLNEKAVGRAMKASGKKREEIFLSTKLWPSVYAAPDRAIDETLARLDTEYIDLLFLHQPVGDYMGAYRAMERAVRAGKVKSLGLSNFDDGNMDKLRQVVETCGIKPSVVQVEAHPYYPQRKLKAYLDSFGGKIMAWYPLGHGDTALMGEPVIAGLAEKYGRTPAQVLLRWHTQENNIVIPGSKNEAHIKDNISLFDFALTEVELEMVGRLDKGTRYYTSTPEMLQNYLAFSPDFDSQL